METMTEKTTHTPGPWSVQNYPNSRQSRVTAPGGVEFLETANPGISTDTWNANLQLVAAAPDMLWALRMVRDSLRGIATIEQLQAGYELQWINAAIAKAEGRG